MHKPEHVTRVTVTPYRDWPLRARVIERIYRRTHGGQIRTLVITKDERVNLGPRDALREKLGLGPGPAYPPEHGWKQE